MFVLRWNVKIAAGCAAAMGVAAGATGAPEFGVRFTDSVSAAEIASAVDASPVVLASAYDEGAMTMEGSSGRGLLGMRAGYVTAHGPGVLVDLSAWFVGDDLVISGPGATTDATFVVEVVGWTTRPIASQTGEFVLAVEGASEPAQSLDLAGFSAGSPASVSMSFGPVTVTTGAPLTLSLIGTTSAYGDDGVAFHSVQWNASFASVAVILPAGYTADSPALGIAGSVWTPPCPPDLDGNGDVDVFDLLEYLALWFAGDAGAERTGDDPAVIDVFDLLAYLDGWFAGCD